MALHPPGFLHSTDLSARPEYCSAQNTPVAPTSLQVKDKPLNHGPRVPPYAASCSSPTSSLPLPCSFHLIRTGFLPVPHTCQPSFCLRAFALLVPSVWDTLPPVSHCSPLTTFKTLCTCSSQRALPDHLFRSTSSPLAPLTILIFF